MIGVGVDGVESGAHTLGHLSNLGQEGVPVGEDDENILPGLRSCHGIDERLGDIGMIHIQVSAQYAPQNPLEGWDTSSVNGTCDESSDKLAALPPR